MIKYAFTLVLKNIILINRKTTWVLTLEQGQNAHYLSLLLYITVLEVPAKAFRQAKIITGLRIGNQVKLSQFPDDTTVCLENPRKAVIT